MKISAIGAIVAAATFQRIGSVSASPVPLNPQPLPPGRTRLNERSPLNPQPLPPGRTRLDERSPLNPQPLPPGLVDKIIALLPPDPCISVCLASDGAPTKRTPLNPQPLPPGIVESSRFRVVASCVERCTAD